MSAHQNPLQSAVVACCGVVGALMDGALDALVGIVHVLALLYLVSVVSMHLHPGDYTAEVGGFVLQRILFHDIMYSVNFGFMEE